MGFIDKQALGEYNTHSLLGGRGILCHWYVRAFKSEQSLKLLKSMGELQSQIQASQLNQEIVELKLLMKEFLAQQNK